MHLFFLFTVFQLKVISVKSGSPRLLLSSLAQSNESPYLPRGFLKDHQTINSQHFLSALPHSSAFISVKTESRCCGNHLLKHSVCISVNSANQDASLAVLIIIWLTFSLIQNKWQWCLIHSWSERHAAALKCIWYGHSISLIILPFICVNWVRSEDLSLSLSSEVHLSWKISSSSPTSLSSSFFVLSLWRRGNRSGATGGRNYRCSSHIVS